MSKATITKHIKTIGTTNVYSIQLNLVKWGHNPEKYDIRKWISKEPLRGICLDRDEATSLCYALCKELNLEVKQHG